MHFAIMLVGLIQAGFMTGLILTKKGKRLPDKILVAWLVAIGAHQLFYYLNLQYELGWPVIISVALSSFVLVHTPLMFLYVVSLLKGRILPILWLHFMPFVLLVCGFYGIARYRL